MPTKLEDIIKDKLDRMESVPDAFVNKIDRHQRKVFGELISIIDILDRENGLIIVNESNIANIEVIINQLRDVFFDTEYIDAISVFAGEFDKQAELTIEMFKAGFNTIPDEQIFADIMRVSKRNALSLFNEEAISQAYFKPVRTQLTTSITSGASFKETVQSLRQVTLGNDKFDGALQTHAQTLARTSFSMADRAYTSQISQSIGVEFYKYSGSAIDTTRQFCETRHNKYYHVKEIESWGDLQPWNGWMKGTNQATIFTNLGGWNCRHSPIPYSIFSVPKKDIDRAISKGYFKPDEATRESLGV